MIQCGWNCGWTLYPIRLGVHALGLSLEKNYIHCTRSGRSPEHGRPSFRPPTETVCCYNMMY